MAEPVTVFAGDAMTDRRPITQAEEDRILDELEKIPGMGIASARMIASGKPVPPSDQPAAPPTPEPTLLTMTREQWKEWDEWRGAYGFAPLEEIRAQAAKVAALDAENARLKELLEQAEAKARTAAHSAIEEHEGQLCPEDMGCKEYIASLRSELARYEEVSVARADAYAALVLAVRHATAGNPMNDTPVIVQPIVDWRNQAISMEVQRDKARADLQQAREQIADLSHEVRRLAAEWKEAAADRDRLQRHWDALRAWLVERVTPGSPHWIPSLDIANRAALAHLDHLAAKEQ